MLSCAPMPEPRDDKEFPFEGPCAGGPRHGMRMSAKVKCIRVPVRDGPDLKHSGGARDGTFGYVEYLWNDAAQMWVWQG